MIRVSKGKRLTIITIKNQIIEQILHKLFIYHIFVIIWEIKKSEYYEVRKKR